jgi:hypothetical protein
MPVRAWQNIAWTVGGQVDRLLPMQYRLED